MSRNGEKMKSRNFNPYQRLLVAMSIIALSYVSSYAQIGTYGIYGSAPESIRSNTRFVELTTYSGGSETPEVDYTLPVNGLKNFNFYYGSDGSFLPGGTYKVTYKSLSLSLGYDIVTYSPNSGHTNGVEIRAFNSPPSTPRGIHGVVYGYNKTGSPVLLHDLTVWGTLGMDTQYARTNGNGYFSIYYSNGNPGGFLASGDHRYVYIAGSQDGCAYFYTVQGADIIWSPDTNVLSSGYYVSDAEMDVTSYIPTLSCQ
jgi:hypothetical protein